MGLEENFEVGIIIFKIELLLLVIPFNDKNSRMGLSEENNGK